MRRLVTRRWLAGHVLAAVLVGACLALGWWQIGRAVGGNTLSWAYAVEWPVFAGFVIFIWVREIRRTLDPGEPAAPGRTAADPARRPVVTARRAPVPDDRDDPELAAYNHYLAWLNAHPGARPADYPGAGNAVAEKVAEKPAVEEEDKAWAQP